MIDTKDLRQKITTKGLDVVADTDVLELLDRLETAERERDALRVALEKIADWNCAWGPYPETNEAWCAMALITAREAVRKEYF